MMSSVKRSIKKSIHVCDALQSLFNDELSQELSRDFLVCNM